MAMHVVSHVSVLRMIHALAHLTFAVHRTEGRTPQHELFAYLARTEQACGSAGDRGNLTASSRRKALRSSTVVAWSAWSAASVWPRSPAPQGSRRPSRQRVG